MTARTAILFWLFLVVSGCVSAPREMYNNGDTLHDFYGVDSVQYSSDGTRLLIGGYRNIRQDHSQWAFVYDAATFQQLFTAPPPKPGDHSVLASAERVVSDVNNRFIVTAGEESQIPGHRGGNQRDFGQVKVWDAKTFQLIRELHHGGERFRDAAISPNGKVLAAVSGINGWSGNDTIRTWELETGKIIKAFPGHWRWKAEAGGPQQWDMVGAISVAFSPDGKTLATGGGDSRIRLWDVEHDFAEVASLDCGDSFPERLAYFPDGKHLVSAQSDAQAIIWDMNERQPIRTLELKSQERWRVDVAVSPDGATIATADNLEVRLWSAQTGFPIRNMNLPYPNPVCVAFSPSGRYLAIGFERVHQEGISGSDGVIQWDLVTDQLRKPVK